MARNVDNYRDKNQDRILRVLKRAGDARDGYPYPGGWMRFHDIPNELELNRFGFLMFQWSLSSNLRLLVNTGLVDLKNESFPRRRREYRITDAGINKLAEIGY